ncbi:Chemotaxis protein CheY [Rubripirellula lacrimiformis]|uniref:Chemotaxis protein CheY n=1 Tax=Rubripirellula lacrimiformis TaxID=1930273 RepID=A0A517NCD5_9BACT|nr:response regulator [Rubripirellula lacrimiformis]QDT04698.1 Chemotaxis protein CheY [Rubripirellula lacrimiformis]
MLQSEKSVRCLIADDVRASREVVLTWLKECQVDCEVAVDGQQAWEAIQRRPPNLLITDLDMPIISGLELIQRIRQSVDDAICQIPVLVVTGLCDGKAAKVVQTMGGNGLLQKPLDKRCTISAVLNLLSEEADQAVTSGSAVLASQPGDGMISPTLRRLIATMELNHRLQD